MVVVIGKREWGVFDCLMDGMVCVECLQMGCGRGRFWDRLCSLVKMCFFSKVFRFWVPNSRVQADEEQCQDGDL